MVHIPVCGAAMDSVTEEPKRKPFSVRLSDEERAVVDAAAERAGLETGSYIRQVLLGAPAPRQMRRPQIERKELAKLLGELGKIGSNLNQLAKASNQGLTVYGRVPGQTTPSAGTYNDTITVTVTY